MGCPACGVLGLVGGVPVAGGAVGVVPAAGGVPGGGGVVELEVLGGVPVGGNGFPCPGGTGAIVCSNSSDILIL